MYIIYYMCIYYVYNVYIYIYILCTCVYIMYIYIYTHICMVVRFQPSYNIINILKIMISF